MKREIVNLVKSNALASGVYRKVRSAVFKPKFNTYSADLIKPKAIDSDALRLNLILPTFSRSSVFGGISTALKIFRTTAEALGCDMRIIVTGSERFSKLTYEYEGFAHNAPKNGIFFTSESNVLEIGRNDVFLYTFWLTAFYFAPVLAWQRKKFGVPDRKAVYLIQDYEPGFYAWSTEYMLAESTYRCGDDVIAVFNSKELYDYFKLNRYQFHSEHFFRPCLNDSLRQCLMKGAGKQKREKIIMIYGRPAHFRNAFGLIHSALKKWSAEYSDAASWKIYSLGDKYDNISLKNNTIEFLGKLSLQEYADMMFRASVGISLMVSPHPSYPPLEMSTFGVKTITNTYYPKELKDFNGNIVSMDLCTPELLAAQLTALCRQYGKSGQEPVLTGDYINGNDFNQVMADVSADIREMIGGGAEGKQAQA